jgi:cytochrome oxidase assembly protein ShyY1
MILGVLAFATACFTVLAPWQFDRHTERAAQNAAIDAAVQAPVVPVTDLLAVGAEPSATAIWRQVTATGAFEGDGAVIRLRQDSGGSPVSEWVVPFRLTDGPDAGTVLLVDRGTVPLGELDAAAPTPDGVVTITGRVQADQTDPLDRPVEWQDGRLLARAIDSRTLPGDLAVDGPVLAGYVQLHGDSPGVLTPIGLPQTDGGPFLSYALQWVAFGVIALIGMAVFIAREAFDPRPEDDRADRGDEPPDAAPAAPARARRARFDRSQFYDSDR